MRLSRHFAELMSDIFWSIDGGPDPGYGIWNRPTMPALSACNIIRFQVLKGRRLRNQKQNASTPNTNDRKRQQPRLHLVTKSRGRRELGLPTSSSAVLPLKMMPCTMFRSIQTSSVNGKFTERYHIFLCTP